MGHFWSKIGPKSLLGPKIFSRAKKIVYVIQDVIIIDNAPKNKRKMQKIGFLVILDILRGQKSYFCPKKLSRAPFEGPRVILVIIHDV